MSIIKSILSGLLLTAFSTLLFAADCPSVETVKTTELTQVLNQGGQYVMYSQIKFNGKPWYVADGVFQSEAQAREQCASLLQKAGEPVIEQDSYGILCVYHANYREDKYVIATDVPPPTLAFLGLR